MERKWTPLSQERQLRYNHAIVNTVSDLVFVLSKALNVTRLNPASWAPFWSSACSLHSDRARAVTGVSAGRP